MGNQVCMKKKTEFEKAIERENQLDKEIKNMKLSSSTFVKQSEIKFKDKYVIGKSIGAGHFSEVR